MRQTFTLNSPHDRFFKAVFGRTSDRSGGVSGTGDALGFAVRGERLKMIQNYIDAAMRQARYELIEDDEPYYGEVPELPVYSSASWIVRV